MKFRSSLLVITAVNLAAGDLDRLGRQLFFDKRLSADGSVSCASCHRPDFAFADPNPVSTGVSGQEGKLNTPTVLNLQKARRFFWDGRARSLEQQALGPLLSPIEMGNTRHELEQRIAAIPPYRKRFRAAFGDSQVSLDRITTALASYQRKLFSTHSLYRDYQLGRREQWTPAHEAGRILFFGQAGCSRCHSGPNFTNGQLASLNNGPWIKVPSLREVARTAPYMHDGRLPNLPAVLDEHPPATSLSPQQKESLLRFLEALTGEYSR